MRVVRERGCKHVVGASVERTQQTKAYCTTYCHHRMGHLDERLLVLNN